MHISSRVLSPPYGYIQQEICMVNVMIEVLEGKQLTKVTLELFRFEVL